MDEIESTYGNQKYTLIARQQRDLYENFTKCPDMPVSFCINLPTVTGQVPEKETTYGYHSKSLGFGYESKYEECSKDGKVTRPVMTIALVDRSKLIEPKWDNIGTQVKDYLESLRVNDAEKFDRIVGPKISKLGENWKGEFEKQILDPIKDHVSNEYGYDKLTDQQKLIYTDVLTPVFGINEYYTGLGIACDVDRGYGGLAERVYPSKEGVLVKKESVFYKISEEEMIEAFNKDNKKGMDLLNQYKAYIDALEKSGVVFSVDIKCQKEHGYAECSGKDVVIYGKHINKAREKINAQEKWINEEIKKKEKENLQKYQGKGVKAPQINNGKTDNSTRRNNESPSRGR